jgi:hypothetical protein
MKILRFVEFAWREMEASLGWRHSATLLKRRARA